MKRLHWFALAVFTLASVALLIWQDAVGYDESGLPLSGCLPARILPVCFLAAAACFALLSRKLPAQRDVTGDLAENFLFQNMPAAYCAVAGSFLMLASAMLLAPGGTKQFFLAAFTAAEAVCLLVTVFSLYRGNPVQGMTVLVPACALIGFLIVLYRLDASDPVLRKIYIEILAASALAYSAIERAAFVFRNGAPRIYLPVSAMAVVLSVTAAAERRSPAFALFFAGSALLELGFLAALDAES